MERSADQPRRRGPRRRRLAAAVLVCAALPALVGASCNPPANLTVTTVASGLDRPWEIAFTPDGTMLVTERVGRVRALVGGTMRTLASPADAVAVGEGGTMGLAVDPQFAANRRIYVCLMSNASGANDIRVVRWEVNAGFTALTARADILTGIEAAANGRHSGCRLSFGPDGLLYVATGDAARGTNPQNLASLNGKVLRITTAGAGAPGNPGGALGPYIYTYGHRNPQGLAWSPDGRLFEVEHGTGCDDEVNVLRPGANYGWDPVPGYDESRPMTDLVKFPTATQAVWSSGCPTIAPSGATFLSGAQWAGWDGTLAVAVLKDTHLHVTWFGVFDAVVMQWEAVADRGRLRTAVQGPDGDLYLATDATNGSILRVHPS